MPKKKTARKKTAKKAVKKTRRLGRPKGTGKFGCKTKLVRIPARLEKEIFEFIQQKLNRD
ncbi:MAG: hypothetical protein LBH00_10705 [Planctomycetaceae bacterium]|jgi:hypothetical protein|nr:hypothetical protein [Planctomycetaceae bacterium]